MAKTEKQQLAWDTMLDLLNNSPQWPEWTEDKSLVRRIQILCVEAGNPMSSDLKKERDQEICEMRESGVSTKKVAEIFGVPKSKVYEAVGRKRKREKAGKE